MFEGDPQYYFKKNDTKLYRIHCPVIMLHDLNDIPFPPSNNAEYLFFKIEMDKKSDIYIVKIMDTCTNC
ncbi:hypothetical protein BG74_00935 [Sodalis-like endosymbiont of Proechinophthirus fluctus]|nr:hypothetical protein BG74_00935 [Sodalis-like endosymbiont of Proechinophthirus fluctus]